MNCARVIAWVTAVIATVLSASCSLFTTNDDFGESWKGAPIERLQRAWGTPAETVRNNDGTSELRYDLFKGTCTYYFTTDAAGKIIAYRWKTNGGSCKPIG
jgi:hypothetical protein